ncbi:SGNH/GDSL hydrolase family protein [Roseisalinus antarcticus]|uniref:Uncharacterized protein n=1 Tax=Roseisalinus antarcticus TaxID=254357 RepID=A0A1Y5RIM0_9RHOB|nr:DUF459 domain-containing protein [Roseisalinus antarcticus]SLN18504.1 hypothetical protein ROA7023_00396 [Roseisalinus antarcticus]
MRMLALLAAAAALAACGSAGGRAVAQDMGLLIGASAAAPAPQTAQRLRPDIRPGNPARVLVIGDSLAQGFGTLLVQRAEARRLQIDVVIRGRPSTGLARADYYNWPDNFEAIAAVQRPDIVVAHFGANDMQAIIAPEGRTPFGEAWDAAYRDQIAKVLDVAAASGAVVYWLGPAPDGNTNLGRHLVRLNPIFADVAGAYGATYVPLTPMTAPNGVFERTVTLDGQSINMRTADGSHFTGRGYGYVADAMLDRIILRFPQLGPVSGTATLASASDPFALSLQ